MPSCIGTERYAAKRPHSHALFEQACRVLPGGSTRSVLDFSPFSFRVARAEGSRLVDVDGHEYIDFLGDYSAGLLGHDPGPVAAAVRPRSPRLELRRHPRRRDPSGRARLPALPVDRPGAVHQLGHRGEPDGTPARPALHRPRPHRRVRRCVPRRPAVLRPRRRGAPGAVRLRARCRTTTSTACAPPSTARATTSRR